MRVAACALVAVAAALALPVLPAGAAPSSESLAVAAAAVDFLAANQQPDGGFEMAGFPGFETPDAVLAVAAAGQTTDTWSTAEALAAVEAIQNGDSKDGLDALDDLAEADDLNAGQAAKLIVLDVVALGLSPTDFDPSDDSESPVDLVAVLDAGAQPDGSYGAFNATLFAALANAVLDRDVPAVTRDLIIAAQQANGEWNFSGDPEGEDDDPDTTGLAIQALVAAGLDHTAPSLAAGLLALAQTQQDDGSWQSFGASNPNSTAVAVLAVAAAGGDPTTSCWRDTVSPDLTGLPYGDPDAYLRGLQAEDGHLASPNDEFGLNTLGTSQGVEALLRRWVPVAAAAAITCAPPGADLSVGLSSTYDVTVTNNSDSVPSEGVVMTLTAVAGVEFTGASGEGWTCTTTTEAVSCTLGAPLAPGTSAGVTPEVERTAGACETSSAQVAVTSTTPDPLPANNAATITATPVCTPTTLPVTGLPSALTVQAAAASALIAFGAALVVASAARRRRVSTR